MNALAIHANHEIPVLVSAGYTKVQIRAHYAQLKLDTWFSAQIEPSHDDLLTETLRVVAGLPHEHPQIVYCHSSSTGVVMEVQIRDCHPIRIEVPEAWILTSA